MSVYSEIKDYNDNLLAAYVEVQSKGGTVPANKNLDNLVDAIDSI